MKTLTFRSQSIRGNVKGNAARLAAERACGLDAARIHSLEVVRPGSAVSSLAVLPDGRLASGGEDGNIKVWPKDFQGKRDAKGHYLFVVKTNQPELHRDIAIAFGDASPL